MIDLSESIVRSLDGEDSRLLCYLPYILQDLEEIGSSPAVILNLIKKAELPESAILKAVDLGCGKGVVSVHLARKIGYQMLGIDGISEFIEEARALAEKQRVQLLCQFETGDIRLKVDELNGFDLAILGSIGPIFGDVGQTLDRVSKCIRKNGYVILDDGYVPDGSEPDALYQDEKDVMLQMKESGFTIVEKTIQSQNAIESSDKIIYRRIEKRCNELIRMYPEKAALFEQYLTVQAWENEQLEKHVVCSAWLLQKTGGSS